MAKFGNGRVTVFLTHTVQTRLLMLKCFGMWLLIIFF